MTNTLQLGTEGITSKSTTRESKREETIMDKSDEGMPDEAITEEKRRRFESIAASYMAQHEELDECAVRFDIIGILVASEHKAMIRHHINAFN